MEKVGQITAVHGKLLEITFCRPEDCGHCHACEGGQKPTVICLEGEGRVGDFASVQLPGSTVFKASMLAYVLPIAGLFAGMLIGQAVWPGSPMAPAVCGAAGLSISLLAVWVTEKSRSSSSRWRPVLTKVYPRELYESKGADTHDHQSDQQDLQ